MARKRDRFWFQGGAIAAVNRDLDAHRRALLVAFTGAGKTRMLARIIAERHAEGKVERVLILQHTKVITAKNAAEVAEHATPLNVGWHLGGKSSGLAGADVIVTTVDVAALCASGQLGAWVKAHGAFDLVVIDEAHRGVAPEYIKALRWLAGKAMASGRQIEVLGLTATASRADGKPLASVFGMEPSYHVTRDMGLASGALVPARIVQRVLGDAAGIEAAADDNGEDGRASKRLNHRIVHDEVIRHYAEQSGGRQGLFFCCDIAHAEGLAEAFNGAGIDAVAVSHKTTDARRRAIERHMIDGTGPRVICNPLLFAEGFDAPRLSLVGIVRPLSHPGLVVQVCGRAARWCEGKTNFVVLDYMGVLDPENPSLEASVDLLGRENGAAAGAGHVEERSAPEWSLLDAIEMVTIAGAEHGIDDGIPDADEPERRRVTDDDGVLRDVISRKDAVALGLARYFTGKPCVNGHVAERFSTGGCVACAAFYASRTEHREKVNSRLRGRRASDAKFREAVKLRDARRRSDPEFREMTRARRRARRASDSEYAAKINERARKRHAELVASNPEYRQKVRDRNRASAARRRSRTEYREEARARARERYASDPAYREKYKERKRGRASARYASDAEYREKVKARNRERRRRHSRSQIATSSLTPT